MKVLTYIKSNGISLVVIFLVLTWLGVTQLLPRLELRRLIGQAAPALQWQDLEGQAIHIDDLKGRPTLLVFWATWCGACRNEIPDLKQLRSRVPAEKLNIIAVTDGNQRVEEVQAFQAKESINYKLSMSTPALDQAFGIKAYPTHIWLDASGRVEDVSLGSDSRISEYN